MCDTFYMQQWGFLFRRQFGLPEAVEWDNMTRKIDGITISPHEDRISWELDSYDCFSTSLIYLRLSQGVAVTHFTEAWRTKVPPKVKHMGLPNKTCVLCGGARRIVDHIFFACLLARFMWARVRKIF
jgi:hypothetical protein